MPSGSRCMYWAFPSPPPFEYPAEENKFLYPACGIVTSYRYQRYVSDTADTTFSFKFDYVDSQVMNYLYIARADCITDLDTIELYYSDDDVVYTLEQSWSSPFTLTGVRDNDFLACFDDSDPHRYWRVDITLSSSQVLEFAKMYLGELFDMGREPQRPFAEARLNEPSLRPFRTTSANVLRARRAEFTYEYTVFYEGITNSVSGAFMSLVEDREDRFVLLINTGYPELLNDHEVIHGKITRPVITRATQSFNQLRFIFTEISG